VFQLPLPPNLANSRMHWRVKSNQKKAYEETLSMLLHAKQLPALPAEPWKNATVRAELTLGNHMDDDNAVARCKWALDWIVRAGYLEDDRRSNLKWGAFPEQIVSRKLTPALTITLTREEA
jgi:hypothetical protein